MPYRYSNVEYTEMVRVLAKCGDNANEACREYARLFPKVSTPTNSTILGATQRLRDYGQFRPPSSDSGRPARHKASKAEEILKFKKANPAASTNDAAKRFKVSQYYVWNTFNEEQVNSAMSTEPRDTLSVTPSRTPSRAPSLKKKSISLEQTTKEQSSIWKTVEDSSISSMQSLDGDADMRLYTMQRDTSLDSRLSGGSTQSDVLPTEKKRKKGLFDKLKKMTKSRSIDDHVDTEDFKPIGTVSQGSDSDMSTAGSKRDLRGRITGMFSRKGQLSRGNSKDQSPERPGSATGSATGISTATKPILRNSSSSTLSRGSSARPEPVVTRASSATPGAKRKGK